MKKIVILFTALLTSNMTTTTTLCLGTTHDVQAIVLAAGHGSRLKTGITKMITPICGQPMVLYTLKLLEKLKLPTTVVIGYQKEVVKAAIEKGNIENIQFAEQTVQLGTGHALLASKPTWHAQTILVLNGDMPLIDELTMRTLIEEHKKNNAAISIATSYNIDPANTFGRIVRENEIVKIVEKKHFTHSITDFPHVNVGMYIIDRAFLEKYAGTVEKNNVTGEFYITDLVEIASRNNLPVITQEFPFDTFYGVNTFQELSQVEQIKHDEFVHYWMAQGVRFIMPNTNHLDYNVTIGRGTVVYPGVHLLNGTQIGEFCTIQSHAVLDNAKISDNTTVEPFTYAKNRSFVQISLSAQTPELQNL